MNSTQESKLSMYLAVKEYLTANAAILTPLPNYSGFFTTFQNSVTAIQTYSEQQQFDKTGIAVNKNQLKQTLITLVGETSRRITAYATFANNQVLLKEVKVSESKLKKLADTALKDATQGIYDRAQTNLTALATYGITAATQTTFQAAITAFVTAIPKPRLGINDKKQSTLQVAANFKTADTALDNIDTAVDMIKLTQANFYSGYKGARKIVETGQGSLAVQGVVTDSVTGNPVKGAVLMFVLSGNTATAGTSGTDGALTKKTAEKGGFNIKTIAAGVYTVTVTKTGYKELVTSLTVADGELSELDIQLTKG